MDDRLMKVLELRNKVKELNKSASVSKEDLNKIYRELSNMKDSMKPKLVTKEILIKSLTELGFVQSANTLKNWNTYDQEAKELDKLLRKGMTLDDIRVEFNLPARQQTQQDSQQQTQSSRSAEITDEDIFGP